MNAFSWFDFDGGVVFWEHEFEKPKIKTDSTEKKISQLDLGTTEDGFAVPIPVKENSVEEEKVEPAEEMQPDLEMEPEQEEFNPSPSKKQIA